MLRISVIQTVVQMMKMTKSQRIKMMGVVMLMKVVKPSR